MLSSLSILVVNALVFLEDYETAYFLKKGAPTYLICPICVIFVIYDTFSYITFYFFLFLLLSLYSL